MRSWIGDWLAHHEADLIAVRRELHAHPELGWQESRATALVSARLTAAGLSPTVLEGGTGLVCDIGSGGPVVALRADLDALPLEDLKDVDYRSVFPGVCHACGHDVHTAVVLGAGLALAGRALPGTVRLVFQPAEELMPGGALAVIDQGWMEGVTAVFALHCDPSLEIGHLGLRSGPLTSAADQLEVRLSGPGGHTSRPQNTVDLVHALATLATGLPAALSRLVDPRAGVCLVWGRIAAGRAPNAIPRAAELAGTVRALDRHAWELLPDLVARLVPELVAPFGATASVSYTRGVPPVDNDPLMTALLAQVVQDELGPGAGVPTVQSLGGEDFAWYLHHVPGTMARLGVKGPEARTVDLHQGHFDVDERAIGVGVRVLGGAAVAALDGACAPDL